MLWILGKERWKAKEESKLSVKKDLKFAYLVSQSAIKDLYCFLKEAIKYVGKNLA